MQADEGDDDQPEQGPRREPLAPAESEERGQKAGNKKSLDAGRLPQDLDRNECIRRTDHDQQDAPGEGVATRHDGHRQKDRRVERRQERRKRVRARRQPQGERIERQVAGDQERDGVGRRDERLVARQISSERRCLQENALKVIRVKVSFTPASVWILLVTKWPISVFSSR